MKKLKLPFLFLLFTLFSACSTFPGYVNTDGTVTPPYSGEIEIKSLKGFVSISPVETSKGSVNINPEKSDLLKSQKQNTIYLSETKPYYYKLEGNHSVVLSFRTMDEEAIISVTYKNKTTEYVIHSSDMCDKVVYLQNY